MSVKYILSQQDKLEYLFEIFEFLERVLGHSRMDLVLGPQLLDSTQYWREIYLPSREFGESD